MSDSPRWKVVYFRREDRKLKRYEKPVFDPKKAQLITKKLQEAGVKAHVVCRRFPKFPPKGEPEDPDMVWCPYCRRWRWFSVPRTIEVYRSLEIKACQWCHATLQDYYVRRYNPDIGFNRRKRRKRKRKRG